MDARALLREQFARAHELLERTIADSAEILHGTVEGAKDVGTIASIYAHVVYDEDVVVVRELRGRATLFEQGGWGAQTGLALPSSSSHTPALDAAVATLDLATFRPYAAAVYAETNAYLESLDNDALGRELEWGGATTALGSILGAPVLFHTLVHQGEIAALKGVHGLQGLRE